MNIKYKDIITLCDFVYVNGNLDFAYVIRSLLKDGKITIVDKQWEDGIKRQFSEYHQLDITNDDNLWITYPKCADTIFTVDYDVIYITVKIYDGDRVYGSKQSLSWFAKFKVDDESVLNIETINDKFTYTLRKHLNYEYDEYLLSLRNDWVKEKMKFYI